MSYWKTLTTTNLRVYFPVKSGGNLLPNLSPTLFTSVLINTDDTLSATSSVIQSSQRPGIYYTDIDSNFLITNGIGMYGLSIGVHKPAPNKIDDEVLFPIEVTEGDIAQIVSIVNETLEKTDELWKLHGLDPNNELTVDQNGRSVDDIEQVFTKVGTQVKVNRN